MSKDDQNNALRQLPAVHTVLAWGEGRRLVGEFGLPLTSEAASLAIALLRREILDNPSSPKNYTADLVCRQMRSYLHSLTQPRLKRVVNATGIILHTNLGRSVLSERAREAILEAAAYYTNLEYDLREGKRGSRYDHVKELLLRLTGAEDALVVNNNAGAVLLVVNTLARGKEVVISRGEMVEIGGSFRIPEVLEMGGVTLREVGTTNRTHYSDYQKALTEQTGMILKVHASNYRIVGFTKSVSRKDLSLLAQKNGLPLVEDLGSGSLIDLSVYGLQNEDTVERTIKEGVDVVTFSGDKLLAGPQAGIIAGKKQYIERMKANPLTRALRIDKLTLAGLEAVLREHLRPDKVLASIPTYRMLQAKQEDLRKLAEKICLEAGPFKTGQSVTVIPSKSQMGGGSVPGQEIPSYAIAVSSEGLRPDQIDAQLRSLPVPVIGYIEKERYLLDMRTLLPGDEEIIKQALVEVLC